MAISWRARWTKRLLLGCALPTVLCLAGAALFFYWVADGLTDGLCANQVLYQQTSPDGALKAVVFERDCGATTGFSTQVSILPANEELQNEGGNLFTCDTNHGMAASGPGGGPAVDVTWSGSGRLMVKYDKKARFYGRDMSLSIGLGHGDARMVRVIYSGE